MSCSLVFFFFFKQKTAYEMRISDWSSDVCSSDLDAEHVGDHVRVGIGTGLDRRGVRANALRERRRVGLARMREQALGDVEQLGHPDTAARGHEAHRDQVAFAQDRKSTRLNSSH